MSLTETARRLVPGTLKGKVKQMIQRAVPLTANNILGSMYLPPAFSTPTANKLSLAAFPDHGPNGATLPLPPSNLRMAYGTGDDYFYNGSGLYTATWLRKIMAHHEINLHRGTRAMEWGCASGRVLRHFQSEARSCEFWGVDQAAPHIAWAKQHLHPPFKFVTCTAYPHLPFEDNSFDFIYGISIFTHLIHLIDAWVMEFRRILRPGATAIFTIHDEHTIRYFHENPDHRPPWLEGEDLAAGLTDDFVVYGTGDWDHVFTFLRDDYIEREWSQYLNVLSFHPCAEAYQTAVVLQK